MKVSGILSAALFMAVSASATAGVLEQQFSVNSVKFNGKVSYFDFDKDRIRSEKIDEKDIGSDLCEGDLAKGEEVVAFLPCPGEDVAFGDDFFLGVWDRNTGERNFSCGLAYCYFWNSITEDDKNGDFSKADGLMYCENSVWWFEGSANIRAKEVKDKKNESGLDGMNCVKSIRSISLLGEVDEDPLMYGKFKINRVQDGATSTEVFGD
jgi:hypothetical protein